MNLETRFVRKLNPAELPAARELIFETFLKFVAPDYTEAGVRNFKEFIFGERLAESAVFYGVFEGSELKGALAAEGAHIRAFFIQCGEQGKGYGGTLMRAFLSQTDATEITVNASPYGRAVYEKFGFTAQSEEQQKDGMRFTPMKLKR